MKKAILIILVAVIANGLFGETIAYWRMGDDTSVTNDSSGNGLYLTKSGTVEDANLPYDGNVSSFHGAGAAFSNPIPATGVSNTKAMMNYSSTYMYVADPFVFTNFTVEAYFNAYDNKTTTQYLISHFYTTGNQRSWAIGIADTDGTLDAGANEMYALVSSQGGDSILVPLGLVVTPGVDYYIAFTYNSDEISNDIIFYYQDLTNEGSLQKITVSSTLGLLHNSTTLLRIGAYNGNSNNMPGLIDEVRISDVILSQSELLISSSLPMGTVIHIR